MHTVRDLRASSPKTISEMRPIEPASTDLSSLSNRELGLYIQQNLSIVRAEQALAEAMRAQLEILKRREED